MVNLCERNNQLQKTAGIKTSKGSKMFPKIHKQIKNTIIQRRMIPQKFPFHVFNVCTF